MVSLQPLDLQGKFVPSARIWTVLAREGMIGLPHRRARHFVSNTTNLAERIRERRRANALSQTELAERLHVSQTTISFWEKGKGAPGARSASKNESNSGRIIARLGSRYGSGVPSSRRRMAVSCAGQERLDGWRTCSQGRCERPDDLQHSERARPESPSRAQWLP